VTENELHATVNYSMYARGMTQGCRAGLWIVLRILSNYVIAEENLPLSIDLHVWDTINPSFRSTKTLSLVLQFHKKKIARHSKIIFLNINEHSPVNERISLANHSSHCFAGQGNDLILLDSTETFELDHDTHLILKKPLNVAQTQQYQLLLKTPTNNRTSQLGLAEVNQCSIQIRIYVVNAYSIFRVYPYFAQSFYILTSNNLSQWSLPLLPSYVNYVTSQPNVISIDEHNRSIRIQSPSLFSSYAYDCQIEAIDTRTPSLSSTVSVRLFFGHNLFPPRLLTNASEQTIQLLSSESIYQMEAMDPDMSSRKEKHPAVLSIEYAIEPSSIYVDIDRYSGRLYIKASNQSRISSLINITLTMTDFGQPKRLITRETLRLHLLLGEPQSHREIAMMTPSTLILAGACLLVIVVLFLAILLLCHCCSCRKSRVKSTTTHHSTSWKNISPNTPDTRLIDHEYVRSEFLSPRSTLDDYLV
jgi:hypothetical protein